MNHADPILPFVLSFASEYYTLRGYKVFTGPPELLRLRFPLPLFPTDHLVYSP
jgi:hypothetical protein